MKFKKESKTPKDSWVEMRQIVMPNHTNPQNAIFGGVLMSWIDMAAAMTATRHSERTVVTAHIDSISFKAPIKIGHHVLIKAAVNYVGRTSMEVGAKVIRENPLTGESETTTTAYLTFVALDDNGKPTEIPNLKLVTKDDKRRHQNAQKRVALRKKLINSLAK